MTSAEKLASKRKYYAVHPEYREKCRVRAVARRLTPEGRAGALYFGTKHRARLNGLAFTLSRDWIVAALDLGVCSATGIPFDLTLGNGRGPFSPSIDRIDNSQGYVDGNCRLVVWIYNTARNHWGDEPLRRMVEALASRS